MDRIKRLRWQQRSLPDSIKINLSPQEIQVHYPSMWQSLTMRWSGFRSMNTGIHPF